MAKKMCPRCGKMIPIDASKCRHCGKTFSAEENEVWQPDRSLSDATPEAEKETEVYLKSPIPGLLSIFLFVAVLAGLAATAFPPGFPFSDKVSESWLFAVVIIGNWVQGWIPLYWIWPVLLCLGETVLLFGFMKGMTDYRHPFTLPIFSFILFNIAGFSVPWLLSGVLNGDVLWVATIACQTIALVLLYILGRKMGNAYEKGLKELGNTLWHCADISLFLLIVQQGGAFIFGPVTYEYIIIIIALLNFLVTGYLYMTFLSALLPPTDNKNEEQKTDI